MADLIKRIVTTEAELKSLLTTLGFTITNNQIRWAAAPNTQCYWEISNGVTVFKSSDGLTALTGLTDFNNSKNAGIMFTALADGGCILFITPLDVGETTRDLTFNTDPSSTIANGLVCITPPESDGYWRFVWRENDPQDYRWCVDDTKGGITVGVEIPAKNMIDVDMLATLVKAYMETGELSNNIYVQVLGKVTPPGIVFKVSGQKFITFNDKANTPIKRTPCFKLPPEAATMNIPTSTEEYSPNKLYRVKDYCIYDGYLYRCLEGTVAGEPFNPNKWLLTTVYQEKMNG